jgi:hypothetical protein
MENSKFDPKEVDKEEKDALEKYFGQGVYLILMDKSTLIVHQALLI